MSLAQAIHFRAAPEEAPEESARCRACGGSLSISACDLGAMPLANAYLSHDTLDRMEPSYPLHAKVCGDCFLMQVGASETPDEIFGDYAYFSSYSEGWLKHAERYAQMIVPRLGLSAESLVIEVASNDGYLLQNFKAAGIPALGIEPAANVAQVARGRGIRTESLFFGQATAAELQRRGETADLIVANNVLAHVPDINDFVAGFAMLLKPQGVVTVEFPHVLRLLAEGQFDTIYHEHFSYLSLYSVERLFQAHGLRVFDVDSLTTHGGSLRLYACREAAAFQETPALQTQRQQERDAGIARPESYRSLQAKALAVKLGLLEFLIECHEAGRSVAGYGAPAKGNTLLNYCGIGPELLPYTVDRNPHKQGQFLPGSRIPIAAPERLVSERPDVVLILPWNLREEIASQLKPLSRAGTLLATAVPRLEIIE